LVAVAHSLTVQFAIRHGDLSFDSSPSPGPSPSQFFLVCGVAVRVLVRVRVSFCWCVVLRGAVLGHVVQLRLSGSYLGGIRGSSESAVIAPLLYYGCCWRLRPGPPAGPSWPSAGHPGPRRRRIRVISASCRLVPTLCSQGFLVSRWRARGLILRPCRAQASDPWSPARVPDPVLPKSESARRAVRHCACGRCGLAAAGPSPRWWVADADGSRVQQPLAPLCLSLRPRGGYPVGGSRSQFANRIQP
jgi:hypothetical protein